MTPESGVDPTEVASRVRRLAVARLPPGVARELALGVPDGLTAEQLTEDLVTILDAAEAESRLKGHKEPNNHAGRDF